MLANNGDITGEATKRNVLYPRPADANTDTDNTCPDQCSVHELMPPLLVIYDPGSG